MAQRRVTVASKVGLHARPAAVFVRAAGRAGVGVTIAKEGSEPIDARSLLAVMSLDVRRGDEVILAADGAGVEAALDELVTLLGTDLDAEPSTSAAGDA
jgi:phosphocarrier protein HPr